MDPIVIFSLIVLIVSVALVLRLDFKRFLMLNGFAAITILTLLALRTETPQVLVAEDVVEVRIPAPGIKQTIEDLKGAQEQLKNTVDQDKVDALKARIGRLQGQLTTLTTAGE